MLRSVESTVCTRRGFLAAASLGAAGALSGCLFPSVTDPKLEGSTRLTARPGAPTSGGPKGRRALGLGDSFADGVIYVPESYTPSAPAPFVLLLHGAGGAGETFITRRIPEADTTGQILLAPDSRAWTWDGIGGSFGPDIKFLDDALRDVFAKYAIDPRRVSVAGFSDGATMSLALGVANGDLFPRVTAWSPGFLMAGERVGTPAFFISHGTLDAVLPIGSTSREIVPALRNLGYAVEYREFIGQHLVPDDVLHESMAWMAG